MSLQPISDYSFDDYLAAERELIDEKQWQELIQAPAPPVLEVGGFGSHHPGVVSVCMAGGAVISLWNAIDLTVFDHLGNRSDGEMMGDFQ